jgi:hypothetical protein
MQLLKYWRELIIVVISAACALLYYTRQPDCPPSQPAIIVPVSKEEDTTTKVVKVTTKPSGATITETTETVKSIKEKSKAVVIPNNKPHKYSIGVSVNPLDLKHFQVDVGARLGNLPAEAVLGYDTKDKDISVGVRINF